MLFLLPFLVLPLALAAKSPKRGLVDVATAFNGKDDAIFLSADLSWYYNYGVRPSPNYADSRLQFVPMLFTAPNSTDDTSFADGVREQIKAGATIPYVLAFNEPDGEASTGGSNIAPEVAAAAWQASIEPLKADNISLGGPAVTGSPRGFVWLADFFAACAGKCSVDFLPVHWYGNFEGLASHIGQVRGTYPNVTVWVTEYALAHSPLKESQSFMTSSAEFFDRVEYITHYSYFGSFRSSVSNVGPNAAMLTQDGKITDLGAYYLDKPKEGNVPKGGKNAAASVSTPWGMLLGALVCGVAVVSFGL
ncbi:MAG: hypothetical protein M1832_001393 [Thelocarpon impressellum]|nr:MAG: hypothetical protein M1832_001393 [Thelocarpon impressellum]